MTDGKNNIPGPKFGLNEIINHLTSKVIEAKQVEMKKYSPLRPSSAGKCERELGYEFMEYRGFASYSREAQGADTHRLLNLGGDIEYHAIKEMQEAFKHSKNPIQIKYKQQTLSFFKLGDGTLLEGKIDLYLEIDGVGIICDWKSKSDKYSQFYKTSWDEFPEKLVATGFAEVFGDGSIFITNLEKFLEKSNDPFFNNNLYQLNFYGAAEFLKERGCKLASILQYNKNDSRIREIRFVPSEAVYEKTKAKFLKVQALVDQEKSAEGLVTEYILGSMKCAFCSFKKQCWPEDDALKKYFETLPPKQWPKDLDRLPKEVQKQLQPLFEQYHTLPDAQKELEKIEEKICQIMNNANVFKIRIKPDQIYRMKRLKSGGVGGGERYVLRRDKL